MTVNLMETLHKMTGISEGNITDAEISFAREVLRTEAGQISIAIDIIGMNRKIDDKTLLEYYLYNSSSDVYRADALISLCRYMGLYGDYRTLIEKIILDPNSSMRLAAINICGDIFENKKDKALLEILFVIMENSNENAVDRVAAMSSMYKYYNLDHSNIIGMLDASDPGFLEAREIIRRKFES